MNIVQITPGAGGMFCGVCVRDNALVAALRKLGHHVTMIPLYLPLNLDEADQSADTPIFFSGINVYLQQKSSWFGGMPKWFHRLMASRGLLKWVGAMAAKTRPEQVGEITLSMLRGEEGRQTRELEELIAWLKTQPKPDVICLSNVLLIGLARKLRSELGAPIICMLQGEDGFLDALLEPQRTACWKILAERAKEVEVIAAPSGYFGDFMAKRLSLNPASVLLIPNGINLDGYESSLPAVPPPTPVLGYFARMCPDKGLDLLVTAFLNLRQRGRVKDLKLRIGGGCGPADEPFVAGQKERIKRAGLQNDVEFCPNLDHPAKVAFLRSLTVFCVPARCAEAFGLYVLEALAAGVPVVQPDCGAFPELVRDTGGGCLFEGGDSESLADKLEGMLLKPETAKAMGAAGQRAVKQKFSSEVMAQAMVKGCEQALARKAQPAA